MTDTLNRLFKQLDAFESTQDWAGLDPSTAITNWATELDEEDWDSAHKDTVWGFRDTASGTAVFLRVKDVVDAFERIILDDDDAVAHMPYDALKTINNAFDDNDLDGINMDDEALDALFQVAVFNEVVYG